MSAKEQTRGLTRGAGRAISDLPECSCFRHVTYVMHNMHRAPVAQLDRAAAF
jgi:hypothetical protein